MPFEEKNMSGALFKNDKEGGNPNWPDYRGSLTVSNQQYELAAWIKTSKAGKKYMSLSVNPKLQSDRASPPTGGRNDPRPAKQEGEAFSDDIPF